MADTTTTDDTDPAPNRYVIRATIVDGTIRLTSPDLSGDTIEVPRGEDAVIKITDTDGYYLYAAEVPAAGERSICWGRNTDAGIARRKFVAVATEANNIVYAVSTRSSAEVKYGPVIKIKPKG
jgi:hypothetical protein